MFSQHAAHEVSSLELSKKKTEKHKPVNPRPSQREIPEVIEKPPKIGKIRPDSN